MSDVPTRPRPDERPCPSCGSVGLERGYLEDEGETSRGFVKWIAGPLVTGRVGRAKTGRDTVRMVVDAYRCPTCHHLALFATRRA